MNVDSQFPNFLFISISKCRVQQLDQIGDSVNEECQGNFEGQGSTLPHISFEKLKNHKRLAIESL